AFGAGLPLCVLPLAGLGDSDLPPPGRAGTGDRRAEEAWRAAVAVPTQSPWHGARPSHGRELLLTFDDGPDLEGTPLILEELDRRNLKAIFFVTGWQCLRPRWDDAARRDLMRKIAAHGHLVGNHTLHHANLCKPPVKVG